MLVYKSNLPAGHAHHRLECLTFDTSKMKGDPRERVSCESISLTPPALELKSGFITTPPDPVLGKLNAHNAKGFATDPFGLLTKNWEEPLVEDRVQWALIPSTANLATVAQIAKKHKKLYFRYPTIEWSQKDELYDRSWIKWIQEASLIAYHEEAFLGMGVGYEKECGIMALMLGVDCVFCEGDMQQLATESMLKDVVSAYGFSCWEGPNGEGLRNSILLSRAREALLV